MTGRKILFLDRDGTLVEEPADQQVDSVEKVRLMPGVIPALLKLRDAGYSFVIVSNQDGRGTDSFPEAHFATAQSHIRNLFSSQGIVFEAEFFCPHFADDHCSCRKPAAGLLSAFLANTVLDTESSAVIGDRDADMQLAEHLGLRGCRICLEGDASKTWAAIADNLCAGRRAVNYTRNTRETRISGTINLDSRRDADIRTGIGFFDHMLEQIAKHGDFYLQLQCDGDTDIDEHHTVEDVALALGAAMSQALGDRRGIGRYGFTVPMDEALAEVAIDISGRPHFVFDGAINREAVGGLPTELVSHFFQSFAQALGAALHIRVRGDNAHHVIEACFKATGRALRPAIAKTGEGVPSTKGLL